MGPGQSRLTNGTALIVLVVVLGLLLLTVQPWSRTDPAAGTDSSGSSVLKGALLMLWRRCPPDGAAAAGSTSIPAPLALFLLYGIYVVISSAFQPDALQAMFRGTRAVLGLVVPVLLWSVVRGLPADRVRQRGSLCGSGPDRYRRSCPVAATGLAGGEALPVGTAGRSFPAHDGSPGRGNRARCWSA